MAWYHVTFPTWASVFTRVEADSEAEAIEKAFDEGFGGLCYQCSRHVEVGDDPVSDDEIEVIEVNPPRDPWGYA